jgi:hypothetical protein
MNDWFSWNDGETRLSVKVDAVMAVVVRPTGGEVYLRGAPECLVIGKADAEKLKHRLGIEG